MDNISSAVSTSPIVAQMSEPLYSYVGQIEVQRLRIIRSAYLELSSGVNMLVGHNASGKSTFCEALSLLFHGRSFRSGSTFQTLTQYGAQEFQIRANLYTDQGEQSRLLMNKPISGSWRVKKDDIAVAKLGHITRLLPISILAPELNNLIDGEPSGRRRCLDWLMFHVEQSYGQLFELLKRCLKQRNALLRTKRNFDHELLSWTHEFIAAAQKVGQIRESVIKGVNRVFQALAQQTQFSAVTIILQPGWVGDNLHNAVKNVAQMELRRRTTLVGPHRADLLFVDGDLELVKPKLSRGEKKQLSVLFLVACFCYLQEIRSQKVLMVVDDWRSELDERSRQLLLKIIMQANMQAIITTSEENDAQYLKENAKMFHVEHGQIIQ